MTDSDRDQSDEGDEFDFGHLLGATRFSGVEDAAVRDERDDLDDAPPPRALISEVPLDPTRVAEIPVPRVVEPAGGDTQVFDIAADPEPSDPDTSAEPETSESDTAPEPIVSEVIADTVIEDDAIEPEVIDAGAVEPEEPENEEDDDEEDEDDSPTISLTVLRAIQATPSPPPGPTVQAVHCPSDHPNPPHGEICRQCAQRIVDRTVSTIARPSLGTLQFDNGTLVALDQPAVIGRKPRADIMIDDEVASPVRIEDPDKVLSRTHLEVRLVDWQVQIVDRDSMNHTYVEVPGHPPFRLRPAEPYPIPPGTRVSLGECVDFTFEVEVE